MNRPSTRRTAESMMTKMPENSTNIFVAMAVKKSINSPTRMERSPSPTIDFHLI
jgi:hypothetical protein